MYDWFAPPKYNIEFPPSVVINKIAKEHDFKLSLFPEAYFQALGFIARVSVNELRGKINSNDRDYISAAPHTWLIPMFFALVWAILLIYVVIPIPAKFEIYASFGLFNILIIIGLNIWYIIKTKVILRSSAITIIDFKIWYIIKIIGLKIWYIIKTKIISRPSAIIILVFLFLWLLDFTLFLFNIPHLPILFIH